MTTDRHELRTSPTARGGTYRIICRIDDAAKTVTVTVVDIDHRSDVYRTR
ncbi:MAG: hypothetical protein KJO75_16220 [Dactylosporangium sp.]|nr:hypothetical protein [Dactylosporangium sp.]